MLRTLQRTLGFGEQVVVRGLLVHLEVDLHIVETTTDRLHGVELRLHLVALAQELLRLLLVCPELRLRAQVVQFADAFDLAIGVKETSAAGGADRGSR
jgi:hypothetical protein